MQNCQIGFGDIVETKDGFVGIITGINHSHPPHYDVTQREKPYRRINGIPAANIKKLEESNNV